MKTENCARAQYDQHDDYSDVTLPVRDDEHGHAIVRALDNMARDIEAAAEVDSAA